MVQAASGPPPQRTVAARQVTAAHAVQAGSAQPSGGLGRDQLQLSSKARRAPGPVEPEPPAIVDTPEEALGLARAGKPVRLRNGRGWAEDVALTMVADGKAADVTIGPSRFKLFAPSAQTPALAREVKAARELDNRLEAASSTYVRVPSVAGDLMLPATEDGQSPAATVTALPDEGETARFKVSLGADELVVKVPKDLDQALVVSASIGMFQCLPAHLRRDLTSIAIEKGASPADADWSEKYHMTVVAAAVAGNGNITFFQGLDNVSLTYFRHESGHVIGQFYSHDGVNFFPDGWLEAIARDGQAVSDYATRSPDEDFAESWDHYLQARLAAERGNLTKLDEMKAKYPARLPYLQGIYENTLPVKRHP